MNSLREERSDVTSAGPAPAELVDLMFRAFCDRTRLRILSLLRSGETCVGDIVNILQAPQPSVSRHLAQLKKAGLVKVRRSGLWKHYSLADPSTVFHSKLLDCAISCFQDVPEIRADNERAARIAQSSCCCSRDGDLRRSSRGGQSF